MSYIYIKSHKLYNVIPIIFGSRCPTLEAEYSSDILFLNRKYMVLQKRNHAVTQRIKTAVGND